MRGAGSADRQAGRSHRLGRLLLERPRLCRALILVPLLLSGIALFPPRYGLQSLGLRLGSRAPRPVVAEFEFPVLKDAAALEEQRRASAAGAPIVFSRDDSTSRQVFQELGTFRSLVEKLRSGTRQRGARPPGLEMSQDLMVSLMLSREPGAMLDQVETVLQDGLSRGLVEAAVQPRLMGIREVLIQDAAGSRRLPVELIQTPAGLIDMARNRALARGLDPDLMSEMVNRFSRANLRFDAEQTEELRQGARDGVDPVDLRVKRGERIVEAREKITLEIQKKLQSYDHWRARKEVGNLRARVMESVGRMLLLLLGIAAFLAYLRFLRPDLYGSLGDLTLLSTSAAAVMALSGLFIHVLDLPFMIVPVAAAPILITLLYDDRLALVVGLGLTGMVGLLAEIGTPILMVLGLGGIAAVLAVRGLRHRWEFYRLIVYVPAVHLVAILAIALAQNQPIADLARDAVSAIVNPILSAGLAIFLVPIAEHLFRKCSDITLLELSDLNRPLMRRLMVEAPGTYHHSLMVGTLAEAAARSVGANPLLARVIGYYHDIGKMPKPDYFIENLPAGRKNPHDRLSPPMSRLVLESHLREGVAMARRERLPHVVVQGIQQHHGHSLMVFFWHKARRHDPGAKEEEYRYPGPRPQSREAALVMLADQVDAASRALEDPTSSRIKGVVLKVLEARLAEGDLDDSRLTLTDLASARDVFVPMLAAFFHARSSAASREEDASRARPSHHDRESSG